MCSSNCFPQVVLIFHWLDQPVKCSSTPGAHLTSNYCAHLTLNYCQTHPKPATCSSTIWYPKTAMMYLEVALKDFTLSDKNLWSKPLWEENLFKHLKNEQVDMSVTLSKCMAHVSKHVIGRHTLCGSFDWLVRMVSGLAKSIPVYKNAGSSLTRHFGSGSGGRLLKEVPSNLLQSVH